MTSSSQSKRNVTRRKNLELDLKYNLKESDYAKDNTFLMV